MNLTQIPFAQAIQLKNSEEAEFIFELDHDVMYTNHLGTVAAAAQFSLAEFASGQWLLNTFPDLAANAIPMLRKSDVKFRKPANGKVKAKVSMENDVVSETRNQLLQTKRALINIPVQVVDESNTITMQGNYEWFIQLQS